MRFIRWATTAFSIFIPLLATSEDTLWGDLSGRFVFDGAAPPPKTIRIDRDVAELGTSILDESLIVQPKNLGIANVVLYLIPPKQDELPVHPSYEATADAKIPFAMKDGRFDPHILLIRTSQKMLQENKDKVGHNANISFFNNAPM